MDLYNARIIAGEQEAAGGTAQANEAPLPGPSSSPVVSLPPLDHIPQTISYNTLGRRMKIFDDLERPLGAMNPSVRGRRSPGEEMEYYDRLEFLSQDTLESMDLL